MSYTIHQQISIALIPKITGSIGIVSSLLLLNELYYDYKKNELNSIKRALLCCTIYELLDTIGWFLSSWALPYEYVDFVWTLTTSNWHTCNIQGLLLQLGIGSPLSQVLLTYFFYKICCNNWSNEQFIQFEQISYTIVFIITFGTGFMFLSYQQYNPTSSTCWLAGYPFGCNESLFGVPLSEEEGGISCERGHYSNYSAVFGFYIILWCTFIIVIVLNILMKRILLKANAAYATNNITIETSNDVQWVTTQALLYTLAFIVTWMPSTLWSISTWISSINGYWLDVLSVTFEPLLGFWNLLIFLRNRPESYYRMKQKIYSIFLFCTCNTFNNNNNTTTSLQEAELQLQQQVVQGEHQQGQSTKVSRKSNNFHTSNNSSENFHNSSNNSVLSEITDTIKDFENDLTMNEKHIKDYQF